MTEKAAETLDHLTEPLLGFGHGQSVEDPRDGLFMFGPLVDVRKPATMRVGVVGTAEGIRRYRTWVDTIGRFIPAADPDAPHHTAFPGFEAIFGTHWSATPVCELVVSEREIATAIRIADRHRAVFDTVDLFAGPIRRYRHEDDAPIDVWFVVIPEEVYRYGRPRSPVPRAERVATDSTVTPSQGRAFLRAPSLFPELNEAAQVYRYEVNFHNQLKARLLDIGAVVQIVHETSLTPGEFVKDSRPLRRVQDPATLAWNLCTTAYFKAAGRPWKLADVREGVCYVGLVFKQDATDPNAGNACCGAQMFLDSGDGLVFKGAVGPWYSRDTKEFHLPGEKASELMRLVVDAYTREHDKPPTELFIHGKTRFNDEEWEGFGAAVPSSTNLVGVRITRCSDMKLYRTGDRPALRGMAYRVNRHRGYLWTKGFVPRLQTYAGREVPNPLSIEICRGEADLIGVMQDVMALTKVNFNACIFADGLPVTLRFADAVGEILTAAPITLDRPFLPFKHYI